MKKILFALTALVLAAAAPAQDAGTVKVTGDRVSLRAGPDTEAVLLDRAMSGDELMLKDNTNPDWVGVAAPETVDCWVHSDYIVDGKGEPALLNIRSGPSLSHSIVGVVAAGSPVTVRGQVDEWLRIAPLPEVTVWISRRYAEVAEPPPPVEPAEAVVEIEAPAETEQLAAEPSMQEVVAAMAELPEVPAVLKPDPDREQGVPETFAGVLKPAHSVLYQLVDAEVEAITLCYVRGNLAQMEAYAQLPLRITGKAYWASGLEMPVIVPSKIEILAE